MASRIRQSATWAPNAKRTSGPYTGGPVKKLLHATIAPSDILPGYNNQGYAPHLTCLWSVTRKTMKPYQHYYFDNFSKALANKPGGVETNTDSVIQTELAGYLGSSTPKGEFDILEAPDVYWEQVADIIGPVVLSWDVPNVAPKDWTQSGRMSYSQWDGFSGLCAHVHVPENDHWDLPVPADALEILQKKLWTGSPQIVVPPPIKITVPKGDTPPRFPLPSGHVFGPKTGPRWQHSGYYSSSDRNGLRTWQARMRYRGWKNSKGQLLVVDGFYGDETARVAGLFQAEKRLSVDRLIGINTWNTAWTAPIT